jgi:hypothetical protein
VVKGVLLGLRLLAKTVREHNEPVPDLPGAGRGERLGCTLIVLLWTLAAASAESAGRTRLGVR